MFSISNDDLVAGEWAEPGDAIQCTKCNQTHVLVAAKDAQGRESLTLLFYDCGNASYLGALNQHLLPGVMLAL